MPPASPPSVLDWALAVSPVVLLLALVRWGRLSMLVNAGLTVLYAVALAVLVFGAGGLTVAVGLGKGAWVGVDNGSHRRADGEKRPIVWRFAAPQGGWSAKQ